MLSAVYDQLTKYGTPKLEWYLDYVGIKRFRKVRYPYADIEVEVRTHLFWDLLEEGTWERETGRMLAETIQEGDVFFDIGSYIGSYTLLASKLVGTQGKVYAFDPDEKANRIIKDNIRKNNLSNIFLKKIALSNTSGNAMLKADLLGLSRSSLVDKVNRKGKRKRSVKTTTLDDFCREHNVVPTGIKIDVEGGEKLVLEGAQKTITRYSPWVFLEFHGNFMSESNRIKTWNYCTKDARKIIFLDGNSDIYETGDPVNELPGDQTCIVFMQH